MLLVLLGLTREQEHGCSQVWYYTSERKRTPKLWKPVSRPAQSVEFSGSLDASADRHWQCSTLCFSDGRNQARRHQIKISHSRRSTMWLFNISAPCISSPRLGFTLFACMGQEATVAFLEYILGGRPMCPAQKWVGKLS